MSVLLPAPFSPQRATTSPARAENDTSRQRAHAPKALGDVPHLEPDRLGRACFRRVSGPGSWAGRSERGMA